MSQQKVDAYKAEKAKRKEEVEKSKKQKKVSALVWKIVGIAAAAGLIAALVITGINSYKSYQAGKPSYSIEDYGVFDYVGIDEAEDITVFE